MILAIDPGKWECGWCAMDSGRALAVGLARAPQKNGFAAAGKDLASQVGYQVDKGATLIVEYPVLYPGDPYPTRKAKDLIAVAYNAGVLVGDLAQTGAKVVVVEPRAWKGSLPKIVHHLRIRSQVPSAVALVEAIKPKGMQHHVWDAVGLSWYQYNKEKR